MVFWSKKYADKAKAEREEVVKKAYDLVVDPKKYNKATLLTGGLLSMSSSLSSIVRPGGKYWKVIKYPTLNC